MPKFIFQHGRLLHSFGQNFMPSAIGSFTLTFKLAGEPWQRASGYFFEFSSNQALDTRDLGLLTGLYNYPERS